MKWDIDREMRRFEPASIPGTIFQRVIMSVEQVRKEGLKVPAGTGESDGVTVWCLGVGKGQLPKHFVYGHSMRECYLRLRRQVRVGVAKLDPQVFPNLRKKPKLRDRKKRK